MEFVTSLAWAGRRLFAGRSAQHGGRRAVLLFRSQLGTAYKIPGTWPAKAWISCAAPASLAFRLVAFFVRPAHAHGHRTGRAHGRIAKMGAVALYTVLAGVYLVYFERPVRRHKDTPRIWDVFDTLTYRERYEDLLARTGCDALTGALDRHSLEAHGHRAVEHAAAAGRPLALLLIDIDHFKSYNDRFGHAAGDKMLKRIVLDIMAAARMSDLTYRFGGDEFVVIADGISAEDALSLGERIRHRIADSHAESADGLTVSVGIASCSRDASDYDTLFEIADKRLYEAKAAGRNRVVGPEKSVRLIQAR